MHPNLVLMIMTCLGSLLVIVSCLTASSDYSVKISLTTGIMIVGAVAALLVGILFVIPWLRERSSKQSSGVYRSCGISTGGGFGGDGFDKGGLDIEPPDSPILSGSRVYSSGPPVKNIPPTLAE